MVLKKLVKESMPKIEDINESERDRVKVDKDGIVLCL